MNRIHKIITFLKAWLFGAMGCQSVFGALVVTGWSYRYCERRVFGFWQKKAGILTKGYRSPRWLRSEDPWSGTWWQRTKLLFRSLKINLFSGTGHGFTAFLATLVPGLLLALAWWAGWNNSFHKGYEQSGVGPGLGVLGILIMAFSLIYLPMAQIHQAVHRRVGAFFDFRQIICIIIETPWGSLFMAFLTALCGLPFVLSALYLSSAVATNPELLELPPVEIVEYLNSYYFLWGALYVFPAFLLLRLLAARIYAIACWQLSHQGRYLHPEIDQLVTITPVLIRGRIGRYWQRIWKTTVFSTCYIALLGFSALPLISQFSAALPATKRWLVHPMVQFPFHHHIPLPLQEAAKSAFAHEQSGFISWLDAQE